MTHRLVSLVTLVLALSSAFELPTSASIGGNAVGLSQAAHEFVSKINEDVSVFVQEVATPHL